MTDSNLPSNRPAPGQAPGNADDGTTSSVGQPPAVSSPASPAAGLKLVALDTVDLTILATHLQDAVVRVRDMAFIPKNLRFALILNRFNWTKALEADPANLPSGKSPPFERRRCAVRFEHVRKARISGFTQTDKSQVLSLMTIGFEQAREGEPDGAITLLFAGGGAIRLEVECIEAELRDIGTGWRTVAKPDHPED